MLKGKYRLDSLLGAGGMGEVYRARNTLVDRDVAIKILHKHHISNREVVGRFMREAKAANAVRHRHIVDVLDIDTLDSGVPFIVQEYLEGCDLSRRLERPPHRLSPGEALDLLLGAVEAVGEAHKRGVVHRDLKPENIYLAEVGGETVAKILDFGISKVPMEEVAKRRTASDSNEDTTGARLTMAGAGLGTPYYMSPEQIRDPATVDARTDVWSFGVIFYEALGGRMPFDAEDLAGLFAQIQTRDPVELRRIAPAVPSGLSRLVHRCLSPNPDERHDDATALAAALAQYRSESGDGVEGGAQKPVSFAQTVPALELETPSSARRSVPDLDALELDLPSKGKPKPKPKKRSKPAVAKVATGDDEDPFALDEFGAGMKLELAVDVPASGGAAHRPRAAATGRSDAPSSQPPSGARGIRVRRRSDKPPSTVFPVLLMVLAGGLVVGGYFAQPLLASDAVVATQRTLGGARATAIYAAIVGAAGLGTLWVAVAGMRRVAYALLIATLGLIGTSLGGLAALGVVAAPGMVPTTLGKVGFLAGPWGVVAAAAGLGLFAVGRGRELRDDPEIGWLGNVFVAAGVLALSAAGWMGATGPRPALEDVGSAAQGASEKALSTQATRFCVTVLGAHALSVARPSGVETSQPLVAAGRAAGPVRPAAVTQ
jgi:serine/threonine protein kinase